MSLLQKLRALFIIAFMMASGMFLSETLAQEPKISREAIDILSKTGQAMAEVTAAVKPAVVNISISRTVRSSGVPAPFFNDPFFRRFFGDEFGPQGKQRERKQANLGSGVIVDKDGYILTNFHVVKGAEEIIIRLADKREFKGKVIGNDSKTDLAVIRIEATRLPVVKWGDSDKLKVGETVIAIGNPFGLSQTVTSGIVSATGRANVGIADYEDFIQTDAAINPGNSGGALVNVKGELIGINTAIFSTSGGYQGIGFAIPSNMARVVMESLVRKGKVVRGWLGISIQPLTPELAKQLKVPEEKGALVSDVTEGSPAEKAGIRRGDIITEYDGKAVQDAAGLRNMVANTPPKKDVGIKVIRDNKSRTVKATILELPAEVQKASVVKSADQTGITAQNITLEIRKQLSLPKQINGVIVTDVDNTGPAGNLLMRGDVIMEVNRKKVNTLKEYTASLSKAKAGENLLLLIYRNGSTLYITIPL